MLEQIRYSLLGIDHVASVFSGVPRQRRTQRFLCAKEGLAHYKPVFKMTLPGCRARAEACFLGEQWGELPKAAKSGFSPHFSSPLLVVPWNDVFTAECG
ncbi:hypothetical protein MTO96_006851 [Rhipicephalus appendiculatus]